MGWFGLKKTASILAGTESVALLRFELDAASADGFPGRSVRRFLYAGRDGSHAIVRAFAPATGVLWEARLPDDDDVSGGWLAALGDVLVTRDAKAGVLVARDAWTGAELWRVETGKLVGRLGIDAGAHELVVAAGTRLLGVSASGAVRERASAKDAAHAAQVLTQSPLPWQTFPRGSVGRSWIDGFALHHEPHTFVQAFETGDTASRWAVRFADKDGAHGLVQVGAGSYEGIALIDDVAVARFELDAKERDEHRHATWVVLALAPLELVAMLREGEDSEIYRAGHRVWKGRL